MGNLESITGASRATKGCPGKAAVMVSASDIPCILGLVPGEETRTVDALNGSLPGTDESKNLER